VAGMWRFTGRDKYLILLACGGVALSSQWEAHAGSNC